MDKRSQKARMISAIKLAANLGRTLQIEYRGEILDLYRSIKSLRQIANKLKLSQKYRVNSTISRNAIQYAIHGYYYGFGVPDYNGIADEEESKEIRKKYRLKTGKKLKRKKIGILREKTTKERLEEAIVGCIASGSKPFTEEELYRAYQLFPDPEYCHSSGRQKGKPILGLIAKVLNEEFHDGKKVRTRGSINALRTEYNKIYA